MTITLTPDEIAIAIKVYVEAYIGEDEKLGDVFFNIDGRELVEASVSVEDKEGA